MSDMITLANSSYQDTDSLHKPIGLPIFQNFKKN